ncbi:hypothetical protein S1OALGB6SA_1395 [Olavius algarvensis spirochete endosymbiont]|uniref:tetratricopeptide repeat protein n=1 Tax=Olavius algarvensis spirochete endosymbiont TaxID=260710 RepID=UPI00052C3022|nr:tetratricopeptide repeat protein [Olavius algarvensis spirochete endosymbiont]KGM42990.1 hypothetical protein JY97_10205 [Alkalispirochaeta odontotermitis]CAD7842281.1 MAG: hypothetical protein [Olavius algarvensis spirochete endosymbiont]VDB00317.1 hypothetical protein S1OALGB6SA_1395 [Olavius algarvensis spirochete endosymbiont]
MKIYNKALARAERWLARGRSLKVIRFLEPKVPLFIEDPIYYTILGRACLESGLLKDADTYLTRGIQAEPNHLEARLSLAVNYLKRKDPASAVKTWLEVLEDYPDDKYARKGLKTLKNIPDLFQQDRFLETFEPRSFLPHIGPRWPGKILILTMVLLGILVGFYIWKSEDMLLGPLIKNNYRSGFESLKSERPQTEARDDVFYPLTNQELSKVVKAALKYYQSYEDNRARYELNKIKYSNATEEMRQQSIELTKLLGEPTIDNLETSYTYGEVKQNPWLFEGVWVLWSGLAVNILSDSEATRFDFLVGMDKEQILEGRVGAEIPFPVVMEQLPLELLARVEPQHEDFILIGKTIHFLR